ncbi:argininosuccinate synthase [Phascolarctobacterium sp.]|uniref:argininosuccinate synthase n=1 Tax=Phascolarctobacterium sp. TaxID=2049039 RepID=UPI002A1B50E4|nr:argininosuccinate synthase [Phascolarctobacterium sp.]MCI7675614.1 argininosuccinate synthase [Phascolarctobacterium sp.]MDY5044515.1 argininosuccinate synthase [Phascolarctobacterium sp.]
MKKEDIKKVVLAYSGGLDTSVIIPWLKENYNGCEVIAACADLGQGDELEPVHDKAIKTGASKCYILDLKEEFIKDYVWPTVKAGAVYEKKYLLGTSFARPLIAKKLVEIAEAEGADAIAHGATGKGNDQVRFELSVKALNPDLAIIAPWREWELRSRDQEIDYAAAHNIPIPVSHDHDYSMDRNMWHLSHEGSDLEDPWNAPKDELFIVTNIPEKAPDKPEYVELEYVEGVPVSVNGEKLSPAKLVEKLNEIGIRNAVGITDMVEDRLVGMKSRGVYENPAGAIIYYGHNDLENLCLDRATQSFKQQVSIRYSELVYDGMWFSPLREALDGFVNETQKTVTGTVRMKLYKGNIYSAGVKSPYSLYSQEYVTFGEDEVYNQADATGFINLFGLPLQVRAMMKKGTLK